MLKLETSVASNDTEVFFKQVKFDLKDVSGRMSVGDCFIAPLDPGGNHFLLRVDALYVPIRKRLIKNGSIHRMTSISVYYPPSYLSDDVNMGVKLKKVSAGTQRPGDPPSYCVGFQRVFSPPVPHELVRHPRPITLKIEDFVTIVASHYPGLTDIPWKDKGMVPPEFIINKNTKSADLKHIKPILVSMSAYNRLCKYQSAESTQIMSLSSNFVPLIGLHEEQVTTNSRIYFFRKQHNLYHLNKNVIRQENLAPKYKGKLKSATFSTEIQCFKFLQLLKSESKSQPQRKLRTRLRTRTKFNKDGRHQTAKRLFKNRTSLSARRNHKSFSSSIQKANVSNGSLPTTRRGRPIKSNSNKAVPEPTNTIVGKKRRGRPPKSATQEKTKKTKLQIKTETANTLVSLDDIFSHVLTPSDTHEPVKHLGDEDVDIISDFSKVSSNSSYSSHSVSVFTDNKDKSTTQSACLPVHVPMQTSTSLADISVPGSYGTQIRNSLQPVTPPPPMTMGPVLPPTIVSTTYALPPNWQQWNVQLNQSGELVTVDTPPPKEPLPLSIWVPQKTPCYNSHPLTMPNLAARMQPTLMPIIITNSVPISFIPQNKLSVYNVTQVNLM